MDWDVFGIKFNTGKSGKKFVEERTISVSKEDIAEYLNVDPKKVKAFYVKNWKLKVVIKDE